MIAITPQILGPGIEEEYDDALERIGKLEVLLHGFPASNETPEGRMVYLLRWLRQEIEGQRLPIPLAQRYWGTMAYLIRDATINHLGVGKMMGELARILDGTGMLKPRHLPVIVAMLDELIDLMRLAPHLDPVEQKLIEESREIRAGLASGTLRLPLDKSQYPGWKGSFLTIHLHQLPDFSNRRSEVMASLFEEWRPGPCEKGPLAAPKPGMIWDNS